MLVPRTDAAPNTAGNSESPFADSPCDPDYYDSLKARAFLEAQREITQNQNLIVKPDSVLEYTCFDQYADVLAAQARNMFSESERWGPINGVTPGQSMGLSLDAAVGDSLNNYITANFNHPFIGKTVGVNYSPGPIQAGSYNCTKMNEVWAQAKCGDFTENANEGFFTLQDYANSGDKRSHDGQACSADKRWTTSYDTALAAPVWPADPAQSYQNLTNETECGSSLKIPTGISYSGNSGNELVCLIPGCISRNGGACSE